MVSVKLATKKSSFTLIFSLCLCAVVFYLFCFVSFSFVVLSKYSFLHGFGVKETIVTHPKPLLYQ